jgi:hypothetical protein
MTLVGAYHQEHYDMLSRLYADIPHKIKVCASKLINHIERWQQYKQKKGIGEWYYDSLQKIRLIFNRDHSIHVIREAIALLIESKILKRLEIGGYLRTHQYQIDMLVLDNLMKSPDSQSETKDVEPETERVGSETKDVEPETERVGSETKDVNVESNTDLQTYKSNINIKHKQVGEEKNSFSQRSDCQKCESSIEEKRHIKATDNQPALSPRTADNKDLSRDDTPRACSTIEIFEKYADRLKLYGVYLTTWLGEELVPNPKIKGAIAAASKVPTWRLERNLLAFIAWIKDAKNVKDIYAALTSAVTGGWE